MNATKIGEVSTCMTAGRRPVTVTVTIENDTPPGRFDLSSPDIKTKKMGNGDAMLTFNNWENGKYSDGFEVTFELEDKTGKGYRFFVGDPHNPDLNDAISVRIVGPTGYCPKRGQRWPDFKPIAISADGLKLTVDNPNKHLQYFGFALHFSLPHQTDPSLTYDPVGDNQNGDFR